MSIIRSALRSWSVTNRLSDPGILGPTKSARSEARVAGRNVARRQMRAALARVYDLIPVPWSIDVLVQQVSDQRHRPIWLVPVRMPGDVAVSGLWLPAPHADFVCYEREATPARRDQIIGHELGHVLMDHDRIDGEQSAPDVGLPDLLAASITPSLVRRFLARSAYEDAVEAIAEEFGTRLVQAGHRRRGHVTSDALGRLTDSLR